MVKSRIRRKSSKRKYRVRSKRRRKRRSRRAKARRTKRSRFRLSASQLVNQRKLAEQLANLRRERNYDHASYFLRQAPPVIHARSRRGGNLAHVEPRGGWYAYENPIGAAMSRHR